MTLYKTGKQNWACKSPDTCFPFMIENKLLMNNIYSPKILIKFLDAKDVKKVLGGNLKMGSVKKYREEYKEEAGLRHDNNEFCDHSFVADQNIDIIIQYKGHQVGEASEIKNRLNFDQRSYIFSMSAITNCLFIKNNTWCFDNRVQKLGDKAILIKDPYEFVRRIKIAIQAEPFLLAYPGTDGRCSGLVEYIDFDTHSGPIGPFRKSKEYDFQKEWRLGLIDSRNDMPIYLDYHFLEVGDLSDISFAVDTNTLIHPGFTLEYKVL